MIWMIWRKVRFGNEFSFSLSVLSLESILVGFSLVPSGIVEFEWFNFYYYDFVFFSLTWPMSSAHRLSFVNNNHLTLYPLPYESKGILLGHVTYYASFILFSLSLPLPLPFPLYKRTRNLKKKFKKWISYP